MWFVLVQTILVLQLCACIQASQEKQVIFFDNSSLLVRFRCLGVDQLGLPIRENYLLVLSMHRHAQRWPRIAVKGILL